MDGWVRRAFVSVVAKKSREFGENGRVSNDKNKNKKHFNG